MENVSNESTLELDAQRGHGFPIPESVQSDWMGL